MSHLAKLTLKAVQRTGREDPALTRRRKLAVALDEQLQVVKAAQAGEQHHVTVRRWRRKRCWRTGASTRRKACSPMVLRAG